MTELSFPISIGEAADKITILQIKAARITDQNKLGNIRKELALLEGQFSEKFPRLDDAVRGLMVDLRKVNEALWDIEDDIREHERKKDFGEGFIKLARAVYHNNDRRAEIKREINVALGSSLIEEKSYAKY